MSNTFAYIESAERSYLRELDIQDEDAKRKTVDTDTIIDESFHTLFYSQELSDERTLQFIENEHKSLPCIAIEQINMAGVDDFYGIGDEELKALAKTIYSKWTLINNLSTVKNIFPIVSYLRDLWSSERVTFFEELWQLLKANLGTEELRLYFHDLKEGKKENERGSLIVSSISGNRTSTFSEGTSAEKALFDHYEQYYTKPFELIQYDEDSGELIFSITIDKGPTLVMAKTFSINEIQKSFLESIAIGLQAN